MSIRFKVILPYLLLTLIVAVTGMYVVTKLVASSLSERLTNQLIEAGRVVSDDFARQELNHVEAARLIAYTRGLVEALDDGDATAVSAVVVPAATGLGIENLVLLDLNRQEQLDLIKTADGTIDVTRQDGQLHLSIVDDLLNENNPDSPPRRALGLNPIDARYYYYTALPVSFDGRMVGVVVVGTSLDTLLPYFKNTSLADVIIYREDGRAIATTLGSHVTDPLFMATMSISQEDFLQIINGENVVSGENFRVEDRSYSLARGPIQIGTDRLGVFAVVLPSNFVLQSGAVSRNTYVIIFSFAMALVVLIGFGISRLIINPLSSLVRTSQAIAGGDLAQRSGIRSADEIGVLASTFDQMTGSLQERTAELEEANHALAKMDRAKGNFIQVAGHELRTPLTLMKGYAQMLEQKAKSDPELEILARGVLDGTERMATVVNSMLDVSKIDSQSLTVVPGKVQLGVMFTGIERKFQTDLARRNLMLRKENLDDLPVFEADPDLLYKVFFHLVANAIKYTPDGGVITLSGSVINDEDEAREIEVVVSDTGVGIDPEHHEMIFQKFYQTGEVMLHSSSQVNFKGGGPGLGLAIARGIVHAHQGRIWVDSPGHDDDTCPGSSFFVRLPLNGAKT